ncbi:hypothetical protein [uncultured Allomuricauda sp.]|uniref:hypothetical protein n=1 Tax=Allomuricauda sp. R78024 TaxID=3093867 RepID=UPI0026163C01|nr:hypothetical protein [uncultured Allomuricauda sp.]
MKKLHHIYIISAFLLSSCSPKISSLITKDYQSLKYDEKVVVLGLNEQQPANAEVLGVVKVRDTGFSTKCNYEIALDKAKLEARKVGGNTIKITRHKKPDLWSTCHRLDATILKI